MVELYKELILILLIAVPYLVFVWDHYVDRDARTLKRALKAIAIGWVMVVLSAAIIMGVDYLLAQTEYEMQKALALLSDRLLFAGLLGWIFPAMIVFIAWGVHLGIHKVRRRWFPHIVFKRF